MSNLDPAWGLPIMMTTMVIVTILHKMEAVMFIGMMHTLITMTVIMVMAMAMLVRMLMLLMMVKTIVVMLMMLLVAVVTIVVIGYHRE